MQARSDRVALRVRPVVVYEPFELVYEEDPSRVTRLGPLAHEIVPRERLQTMTRSRAIYVRIQYDLQARGILRH